MKCKACGIKFDNMYPAGWAIALKSNCRCGQARTKARNEGCPSCGVKGKNVLLILTGIRDYYFKCECGYEWSVEKE